MQAWIRHLLSGKLQLAMIGAAPVLRFLGLLLQYLVRSANAVLSTIENRRFRELSRFVWVDGRRLESLDPLEDMRRIRALWSPNIGRRLASLPYEDFLRTYYWRTIREHLLLQYRYKCSNCSHHNYPLEIHHTRYDIVGKEHLYLRSLMVLCFVCHGQMHGER